MRHQFQYIPSSAWNPGMDGDLSLWLDAQAIVNLSNGAAVSETFTGTASTLSNTIVVSSTTGLQIGMGIYDFSNPTFIPNGTTITNIVSTTLTLSASVTNTFISDNLGACAFIDKSTAKLTIVGGAVAGAGHSGGTYDTNFINGYPAVFLSGSTQDYLTAINQISTTALTILFVGQPTAGGCCGNGLFIEQGGNVNSNNGYQLYGATGQAIFNTRNGSSSFDNPVVGGNWAGTTATKIIAVYGNSGSPFETLMLDGSNLTMNGSAGSLSPQTVTANTQIAARTSSNLYFEMYLFEIAVFNSAKNSAWMTVANNYVTSKWGIT